MCGGVLQGEPWRPHSARCGLAVLGSADRLFYCRQELAAGGTSKQKISGPRQCRAINWGCTQVLEGTLLCDGLVLSTSVSVIGRVMLPFLLWSAVLLSPFANCAGIHSFVPSVLLLLLLLPRRTLLNLFFARWRLPPKPGFYFGSTPYQRRCTIRSWFTHRANSLRPGLVSLWVCCRHEIAALRPSSFCAAFLVCSEFHFAASCQPIWFASHVELGGCVGLAPSPQSRWNSVS